MRHKLWKLLTLTFFSLSLFTPFSCQEDEIDSSNALNQQEIELYKNKILHYTNKLSHSLSNPNSRTKVQNIETNIDFNTMEVHKLSNLEQVITADFAINTNHRGIEGKSKYLFFIHDNQIMRSKIITFNDNGFTNYNELLLSVLDRKHKKPNYTGTITLSSITNKKIHQTTYSNGKLIRYASVMVKKKNDSQQSRGTECYSYYWVTRDIEGNESWEYLYTDCTQDQVPYDEGGGGGGGGGGGDNLTYTPTFPSNPKNNQIYNFYDPYGTYIQYKYNATTNVWQIASVQIAAITITSNPYSTPYPYLLLTTPIHGQEVKSPDGLHYTYNAETDTWYGEPYEEETPCESLKDLIKPENVNVKQDIDWLIEKVNRAVNKNEFGVEFRKEIQFDGTFKYINKRIESANEFSVEISIGGQNIGGAHNHPQTGFSIPSYGDVKHLVDAYGATGPSKKDEVVDIIVCKDQTTGEILIYSIKVMDYDALYKTVYDIWNDPKYNGLDDKAKLDLISAEQSKKYDAQKNDLEKVFLQQFGDKGVSLYKATNTDMQDWNKLELDANPDINSPNKLIVKPIPCN